MNEQAAKNFVVRAAKNSQLHGRLRLVASCIRSIHNNLNDGEPVHTPYIDEGLRHIQTVIRSGVAQGRDVQKLQRIEQDFKHMQKRAAKYNADHRIQYTRGIEFNAKALRAITNYTEAPIVQVMDNI